MKTFIRTLSVIALSGVMAVWGLDALTALAAGKSPSNSAPRTEKAGPIAEAAGTATLNGKVILKSAAPAPQKIKMAADPVCQQQHADAVTTQEVVAKGGNLQYALVYIKEGVQGTHPAPSSPVTLNQVGCMYEPHVFGIQTGQKLEIVNSDPTLHNVNCQPKANKKFNMAQPTKGLKSTKTFDQPEIGVSFKCNIHPWMAAYGGVFAHPFYAVSGEDGSFSIKGLPAGEYTVEAWHEKLGTQSEKVTLADGETKEVSFSF